MCAGDFVCQGKFSLTRKGGGDNSDSDGDNYRLSAIGATANAVDRHRAREIA